MGNKIQMPAKREWLQALEEVRAKGSLPTPKGWRILVMMPTLPEKTAGGIILTDEYVAQEEVASPLGLVVAKGDLCYTDKRKFPDGQHWCEVGDIVVIKPYAGTRIVIHGKEFRSIFDETVEQVVDDPRGIERV